MSDPKRGPIPQGLMRPEDTTVPLTFGPLTAVSPGEVYRAVRDRAVVEAVALIGTREQGGNNRGALVEAMLVDEGGKPGMPWCLAFVQHVYGRAFARYQTKCILPNGLHVGRFARRCMDQIPEACSTTPTPGAIALHYPSGHEAPGHCGVVEAVGTQATITVEGNTNAAGSRDSDKGDGVHRKTRALAYWTLFVDISRIG